MLPSTLSTIRARLTEQKKIDDSRLDTLLTILKAYKQGQFIYPGVLIRQLNLPMCSVYEILEIIKEMGIIVTNFELYCHSCSKFTGDIFETLNQIPEEIKCEECGKELDPLNDSIVVYKVVLNE